MIDALQLEFMQHALIAGLLASVVCGIIGSYIVVKRMVFISGGIAHASFGGVGLGYYVSAITPLTGAFIFAIASALGIGVITRKTRLAEDTAIGVLWSMGMALGIVLIQVTPGYQPEPTSYLFGSILTVSESDLWMLAGLDLLIIGMTSLLYKEFLAICFDEDFSTVVGIPVNFLYLLLLCMVALTVVLLIQMVGIILVIALLTIPAALARQFTHNLKWIMGLAVLFGAVFSVGGIWLSYELDIPSGATIILVGGVALFASFGISKLRHRRT